MSGGGWIGVDLDGTLARYMSRQGISVVGAPIAPMVCRVRAWLAEGRDVRIMTARVCGDIEDAESSEQREMIEAWCVEQFGRALPVTNEKDHRMIALYDDRAVGVQKNTGELLSAAHDAANPDQRPDHDSLVLRFDQLGALLKAIEDEHQSQRTAGARLGAPLAEARRLLTLIREQVIR